MLRQLIVVSLLAIISLPTLAEKNSEKGDPLALAALMIKDRHYLRAQGILENADTSNKNFDFKRFHTLSGITALKIDQYQKSIDHLQEAQSLGVKDSILNVYMAQAFYQLQKFPQVIKYVDKAPDMKEEYPNFLFMKYDAYQQMNQPLNAWDTLKEGRRLHPHNQKFIKQQIFSLIQLGFYQSAAELGLTYTQKYQLDAQDYIAIGQALSQTQSAKSAGPFLESATLKYPDNNQAKKALANYYSTQKQYYTAASIMESVAIQEPELLTEAAELNKLAGQFYRALFLNSRATDQQKKLKQRLGLFLMFEEYEKASLMERDLIRNHLLEDDAVRYALAYSHFQTGRFDQAEKQLNKIKNARLLNKANQVRSAIAECQADNWKCSQ